MNTVERPELPQSVIETLAQEADRRSKAYFAEYNDATDRGVRRAENYAPAADLCSTVFHEYLQKQGKTITDFEDGQVWRILQELKKLHGVANA